MKKHIKLLSSISLFLVLSAPAFSRAAGGNEPAPAPHRAANGDEEVNKKRLINKHYDVTADDKLEIENQFGNVVISTWDKNEITVDIEISAKASSEERAQEIMSEIDVKDYNSSHIISFKTKVGEIHNGKNNRGSDNDRSFYIDYVIHMPTANRLQLENSFGKTEVPNFKGLVTLTSKFGSLNTGRLDNVDAIDVEFGKATIAEINNGKVVFKFNKESKIGKVNGDVKITSEFSHNVQFNIGNIHELTVFESYSGVRMVVDKALSAQIDVHTSFGSFHNDSEFAIKERKEDEGDYGPHFDKDFSGRAGDGRAQIKIKSSFGSVRLSHTDSGGGDDDDKADDKDKHKDKHKDRDDEKTS
jgi:hypothetical protein